MSLRNGGMLYPRTIADPRIESHREFSISFLNRNNLKLVCMEDNVALITVKDGSALRARMQ